MIMDVTYVRLLHLGGILVLGLLATVGVTVVSLLVSGAVRGGLAAVGWLARIRTDRPEAKGGAVGTSTTRGVQAGLGLDAPAAHALLARQAWWRLRC
jgi:hypothetical protein